MGLTPQTQLAAYATWCNTVEGNTTFYALPAPETIESWADQAPPGFRFLFKLPRTVTHEHRLRNCEDDVRQLLTLVEPLGDRASTIWIQLPPSFGPSDIGVLAVFLRRLPASHRYAVEVRHPAFFGGSPATETLQRMLVGVGAEWVSIDTTTLFAEPPVTDAERATWEKKPRIPPADGGLTDEPVVRIIGRDDPERTRSGWQPWVPTVAGWLREGRSPTVFVHTPSNDDSLELARRFHDDIRAEVPALEPLPEPLDVSPATLF